MRPRAGQDLKLLGRIPIWDPLYKTPQGGLLNRIPGIGPQAQNPGRDHEIDSPKCVHQKGTSPTGPKYRIPERELPKWDP